MSLLKQIQSWFRKKQVTGSMEDEMRFHLEKEIELNLTRGMSPEEARRRALIAFGGVQQTREKVRQVHWTHFPEIFFQDLRYAWRMLRKSPGFTAVAVLTLALGIGMNTAIFSMIDALLFRFVPVSRPQELLVLKWSAHERPKVHEYSSSGVCRDTFGRFRQANPSGCSWSLPFFHSIASQSDVFSDVAAFTNAGRVDLSGSGPARMVDGEFVSGSYFQTLGVGAALGRVLEPNDDGPAAQPAVVLSYAYWQSAFGKSASVVGKVVRLNNTPFTIVGVAEPSFTSLYGVPHDLWMPLSLRPSVAPNWNAKQSDDGAWSWAIIGRLKPETELAQAQGSLSRFFHNETLQGAKPLFTASDNPALSLVPLPAALGSTNPGAVGPLYLLLAITGLVLLIACANVAGLLLARAAAREKEIAVRLTLGARRGRVALQLLTESVMLSMLGGMAGLFLAFWGGRALLAYATSSTNERIDIAPHLDWRILAFAAGISVLTGIAFGLAPALRGWRVDLTPSLKAGDNAFSTGASSRRPRFGVGNLLVVAQVTLAMVVLLCAGLLVRSLTNLKATDLGFDSRNVLLFGIDPTVAGYKGVQVENLYRDLQEKVSVLPGVTSASYSQRPLIGGGRASTTFHLPGAPEHSEVEADYLPVGPKFFSTMKIPLQVGRDFTLPDFTVADANSGATPSAVPTPAIVNEEFARLYLPGVNPLGFRFGAEQGSGGVQYPGWQIIGVVRDAKFDSVRRGVSPTIYDPSNGGQAFFELRTAMDPASLVPSLRTLVNHVDNNLALFSITTESEQIDRVVIQERLIAQVSSSFGLLALVLACLGLYGLLSYEVSRRTREIGIRMAVGAQSHDVVGLVLGKATRLILAGSVLGAVASLGVARLLRTFLYGVGAGDPITLLTVTVLLVLVALSACYLPARRATRVDPLVALRYE
jgi:predicted permease